MDSSSFPPNPGLPSSSSFASSPRRQKQRQVPAALKIPPAFQSMNNLPAATVEPVRRKPLPPSALPLKAQPSSDRLNGFAAGRKRSESQASIPPKPLPLPRTNTEPVRPAHLTPVAESPQLIVRDLDQYPRGNTPVFASEEKTFVNGTPNSRGPPVVTRSPKSPHLRLASDPVIPASINSHKKRQQGGSASRPQRSATMGAAAKPPPLRVDSNMRKPSFTESTAESPSALKPPKTPGQKISSFFTGWKTTTSPGTDSSSTEISDNHSPLPSPFATSPQTSAPSMRSVPVKVDTVRANTNGFFGGPLQHTRNQDSEASMKLAEVESELKEISAELAASIRREMELEDLVDQLRENQNGDNRRTSDYYSDSGSGSSRHQASDLNGKVDEMERLKRRSELEKARLKLDMSQKWQDESSTRKNLELRAHELDMQVQQLQQEKAEADRIADKTRQLEALLEDTRRRLAEEKRMKDNFQDLLTAMHEQIEQHKNERDNLRDEIVPQLRARVEGLEAETAQSQKANYDNARLQQQIDALRSENARLTNGRNIQLDMQQQASRFGSIAEEGSSSPTPIGMKRSNSVARTPTGPRAGLTRSPSLSGGLSRSNSLSAKDRETRESLADRMKDVEMQRDALHQAVKSLLDRQAYQAKETEKRIKILQAERDAAVQSHSPRRLGYEKEVGTLREEINHLRRRGDDALEQKWQCEKGLGGLKMDLERAEQETTSLRALLKAHDVLLPERTNGDVEEATSSSLRTALTHLEADTAALAEDSGSRSLEEERKLAEQLAMSSQRVQDLATQVQQQLSTNHILRVRLAETVGRGEREQKASASRILSLQTKLKRLEDTLMVAQQQSEESIAKHEIEIKTIQESHNAQLSRVKAGLRTPTVFSPKSPRSPMFARTPRLDHTSSGPGVGLGEKVRTEFLEHKVRDLEKALKEAEGEMEEVVQRMNMAQIEVAELQGNRDDAMRQTRKLQAEILAERQKVKALMGTS